MKIFVVFFLHHNKLMLIRGTKAKDGFQAIQKIMGKNANPNRYIALEPSNPEHAQYIQENKSW